MSALAQLMVAASLCGGFEVGAEPVSLSQMFLHLAGQNKPKPQSSCAFERMPPWPCSGLLGNVVNPAKNARAAFAAGSSGSLAWPGPWQGPEYKPASLHSRLDQ